MRPLVLAAGLLLAGTRGAEAHIVSSRLGDIYAGALHPLTAPQDVVIWLALGLLAGMQPRSMSRWLVPLFPVGLALGLVLGAQAGPIDLPWLDAAFMVLLGGLTAAALRVPGPILLLLGLAVAVARGVANASGIAANTDAVLFAAGFALVGYGFITLAMALVVAFRSTGVGWHGIAVRASGSWIAAIGLMVGGYALHGS